MTAIDRPEPDIQGMVDELVAVHSHREPYIVRTSGIAVGFIAHHQVKVPALIDQLLEPAPGGTGEMSGAGAQARPAVRVEAHDTIALIASESGAWITKLGGKVPADTVNGRRLSTERGSGAKKCLVSLRALHVGLTGRDDCGREHGRRIEVEGGPSPEDLDSPGFDSKDSLLAPRKEWCCTAHHVEADVRSWWSQARVIAGWDSPTYRPRATCPYCSDIRSLRINLGAHRAVCVACRTVWEPATIGLLAEHIRREVEGEPEDDAEQLEDEYV